MSKYYLIYKDVKVLDHHVADEWFLLERGVDYNGKRKPKMKDCFVLYEANTIPEMLHKMQDQKDWRFYVVSGFLSSKGRKRNEEYPSHRHICPIAGFTSGVCDIRQQGGKMYFDEKWNIEYVRELFICPGGSDGEALFRIKTFTEKIERAVEEYRIKNNLEYGMAEEEE